MERTYSCGPESLVDVACQKKCRGVVEGLDRLPQRVATVLDDVSRYGLMMRQSDIHQMGDNL